MDLKANAYVSGMKEDLHLTGNRLNYINAACKQNPMKAACEFVADCSTCGT